MNLNDSYRFVLFGDSITRGVIFDEKKEDTSYQIIISAI